ncbi:MAG: DNA internalization-related competence protein ComEC/Rec2 [Candidatus Cloacimonetes bacterium]|nr:DNA internalization-related competence protein ComEC/Rec2 [Candidatus Cloacimonadota bacterium]
MAVSRAAPAPLLLPVLAWTAGMVLAHHLALPFIPLLSVAGVLLISAVLIGKLRTWLLLLLFLCLGGLRISSQPTQASPLSLLLEGKSSIQQPISFIVLQTLSSGNNSYAIRMESLAGHPLKDKLMLYSNQDMIAGERYKSMVELGSINNDPILQIYPSRYHAIAFQLGKAERLQPSPIVYAIARLRQSLLHNLDSKLGANAGWAKGLLLSDPAAKKEYRNELSQSGTMHLIAVSGLHVWFIYLVLVNLLRIVVSRGVAELIFLPLILLFAALNNWAPPITRSIIMIGTGIIARWLQRPLSGAQSLSFSLLIITLINPIELFGVGLQMSFICIAVILFGMPRIHLFPGDNLMKHPWQRGMEHTVQAVLLSLLVSLAITPLTLYYFGRASFNGVIANLIGIPLIGILLPLSFLILLFPQGFFLCHIFSLCYHALIQQWQMLVSRSAEIPFYLNGFYFNRSHAIALAIVITWSFLLIRGKFKYALIFALPTLLMGAALLFLPLQYRNTADVHVFACGVADCSLIRLADGKSILIDTGGGKGFMYSDVAPVEQTLLNDSWMKKVLLPWLGRNGVTKLDYLILTHLHADHYGGLLSVLKSIEVEHVIISDDTAEQPLWQFFASRPYFKPRYTHIISDTVSFAVGKARLKFLHPDRDFFTRDENERSLVCRLDAEGKRILFTGDIGEISEAYLDRKYPQELACDYLKVPHHGSRGSSTNEFLQLTKPKEAWLCISAKNRFGFPHEETVQRYRRAQIPLRSTMDGSIRTSLAQKD